MSKILSPRQTLDLLDEVKRTSQQLAARATQLSEEHRTRLIRLRHRREADLKAAREQLTQELARAEVEYQDARARAETNYEHRKFRLGKAYQSSKEQRLQEIDNRVGARKYELQKRMLQAEKDRESGLTAAAAARQAFQTGLAAEQQALAELESHTRRAFAGYRGFTRLLTEPIDAKLDLARSGEALLAELRSRLETVRQQLAQAGRNGLLKLLRLLPLWLLLAGSAFLLVPILRQSGIASFGFREAAMAAGGLALIVLLGRWWAVRQARSVVGTVAAALSAAHQLHDAAHAAAESHYQSEVARLQAAHAATADTAERGLKRALAEATQARVAVRMRNDEKAVRVTARHEELHRTRLERLEREHPAVQERLRATSEAALVAVTQAAEEQERQTQTEFAQRLGELEAEWKSQVEPMLASLQGANDVAAELFPPWTPAFCETWAPPPASAGAAKLGALEVDLQAFCEVSPQPGRFAFPGPATFCPVLTLKCPEQGSLLIETAERGRQQAIGALNSVVLRLLTTAAPGRLSLTILDPVGLGQSFAGVMHIADFEEQIINSKIWTQPGHIEERLKELNEHMEKVIQMYLRNEYATIAEYNAQAGVIAEKYHFLVVADFPAGFTDSAAKRLMSIAASGARCGVYTLVHWDRRLPAPQDFIPDELRKSSFCVGLRGQELVVAGRTSPGLRLVLDEPPSDELAIQFVQRIGEASRDSSRVEVPFSQITPPADQLWSLETTAELRVPIGRTGATKLQYLAIGKGTRQHGLIAGKTGSGKSNLFHVIVTNLALWCSPGQVEFYLVDFKKGVEFKCYATHHLPHARVVAIESDREFGLSVLQRVDEELKRRGDLFRELGVQDLPGYKRAGGAECIPRSLLIIDEFQEFFVEDDKIAQTASLLLDRLVRQGRAFGIHVLLGSQTLGGAYTVARTTLGQMVIRVALQCNEADAYLIMDDSNPAPRLLSRPGEGIYNDAAGAPEGNSPFQVVWLPDTVRDDSLRKVQQVAVADGRHYPSPIVFEGNAPADIRENEFLAGLLEAKPGQRTLAPRVWLGAPNSIKGPTEAVFYRQSGNNLLLVGQREEAVQAMLTASLIALAAQHPPGTVRLVLLDGTPPGSPQRTYFERLAQALAGQLDLPRGGELPALMAQLGDEFKQRAESADPDSTPAVFLVVNGLQKYGKLRFEEDFGFSSSGAEASPSPAAVLNTLLCEGTRLGFHVIASCDTYNNVNRFLSRKAFSEFEMRVLFQMSANDSASLIDNPKASLLGLHRALFFNEQEGHLETFRPYALPSFDWLDEAKERLARRAAT